MTFLRLSDYFDRPGFAVVERVLVFFSKKLILPIFKNLKFVLAWEPEKAVEADRQLYKARTRATTITNGSRRPFEWLKSHFGKTAERRLKWVWRLTRPHLLPQPASYLQASSPTPSKILVYVKSSSRVRENSITK